MPNPLVKLRQWFADLGDEFDDKIPPLSKFDDVVENVQNAFGASIKKYLGAGDNGIAFLSDDGDIIKFTIDKNEALLWNRLKNKSQFGVIQLKNVVGLSSSKTGPSYVYALKAEYAPNPVTEKQARLIKTAVKNAREKTEEDLQKMGSKRNKDIYRKRRAINFIKQFQAVADIDPAFRNIPSLLMDLVDKYGGYIYDLHPGNFRLDLNDDVVLVDPSVPDLINDIENPDEILYEELIDFIMNIRKLIV